MSKVHPQEEQEAVGKCPQEALRAPTLALLGTRAKGDSLPQLSCFLYLCVSSNSEDKPWGTVRRGPGTRHFVAQDISPLSSLRDAFQEAHPLGLSGP